MRRSFLVFALLFLAAAVVVATVSMAGTTAAPKTATAVSSTPSTTPQFVMPASAKPKPSPSPEDPPCLVDICKVDHGVLYHCTANVTNTCCQYKTSQNCVADPNCTYSIPAYCTSDPPNVPPNACAHTCQGQ